MRMTGDLSRPAVTAAIWLLLYSASIAWRTSCAGTQHC